MSEWSAGYVSDIGYTFGCYSELNPLRLRLPMLSSSLVPPAAGTACELGFGQGLSANVHAAASQTVWHGTDFNPSQAAFAQELAQQSGAHAHLYDEAFADFANRPDLPDFDFIGLHGIWSWISDANRAVITDFVRRKLKVGGVLYISYNTQPGWANFAPVRHLMTRHADVMGAQGAGIVQRIDGAIEFTDRLLATNPAFARSNPHVAERVKRLKGQNRHYLAHEYFNRDWHPMHFATMADWLEPAKVSYACSAAFLDHIPALNHTDDQQAFLREIPDAMLRESVRDFMVNQQFRRDYWVKGARRLGALEQARLVRQERVVLVQPRDQVSLKVTGVLGEATLNESVYVPILDMLADHKAHSLGEIEQKLAPQGVNLGKVLQAALVLSGAGCVHAAQDEAAVAAARKTSKRLNAHLISKAPDNADIAFLASPVTGGGVGVGRFIQLFLLARAQGRKQPQEWADFAWQMLRAQGQRLVKEGARLETDEQNLAELARQAQIFADSHLGLFKALEIDPR